MNCYRKIVNWISSCYFLGNPLDVVVYRLPLMIYEHQFLSSLALEQPLQSLLVVEREIR